MKVAVISDIHGNHYALERVLSVAKKQGVSKILVLGDIVGYYYHPDKVMKALGDWDYELIKGNHEDFLLQLLDGKIENNFLKEKYGSGHELAVKKLSKEQINQFRIAPDTKHVKVNEVNILMCHGANFDTGFYLYPDSNEEILKKCNEPAMDFVVVGHSHYPFVYRNTNSTLINVGSVGQSRKEGGIANWLIINTINKSFELMCTAYNINELIDDVKMIDPDMPYLQSILKRTTT
jgi:putative phosphoesterase